MKHFIFLIMLLLPYTAFGQAKKFEEFYPNGKLFVKGFKDKKTGKRVGRWVIYTQDGSFIEQCDYENGLEEGLLIKYNAYNRVSAIVEFHKGKKEGKYISYYVPMYEKEKEWIESTATYRNDVLDGMQYTYDETGKIIQRTRISKGKTLTDTIYNSKGITCAHIEYSEARPEGLYIVDKFIPSKKNDSDGENGKSLAQKNRSTATDKQRNSSTRNHRSGAAKRQSASAKGNTAKQKQKSGEPKRKPRMHTDANGTIVFE